MDNFLGANPGSLANGINDSGLVTGSFLNSSYSQPTPMSTTSVPER